MKLNSIMQDMSERTCYLCGRSGELQLHHAMHGTANRKLATEDGLYVWLCADCHVGSDGVHNDAHKDLSLKQDAQRAYELTHNREYWMRRYTKNFL